MNIYVLCQGRLSDIFDPDNGGTIGVMDIAAGIRRHVAAGNLRSVADGIPAFNYSDMGRLRGEARRSHSDAVCVLDADWCMHIDSWTVQVLKGFSLFFETENGRDRSRMQG